MTESETKQFLGHQAAQYQKHQQIVKKAQTTLDHQLRLQSQGTISKKYRPRIPIILDTDHNKTQKEKFLQEYKKLFNKHLQETITQNTIIMELEKARCQEILQQTEKGLCLAQEPPTQLLQYTHVSYSN